MAHHNKVFFELIRRSAKLSELSGLSSRVFGTYEDFVNKSMHEFSFPLVIKGSAGCRSRQVQLAKTYEECHKIVKRMSRSYSFRDHIRFLGKRFLRHGYIAESLNRRKFILQEFVPDLQNDYKVLCYGNKYYVLRRGVRKRDFRASGSGRFTFPNSAPINVLTSAKRVFEYFDIPYISLDIAETPSGCRVLEAQFLMFGTFTLENANWCFVEENGNWKRVDEKPDLEKEFVHSVVQFIRIKGANLKDVNAVPS